MESEDNVEVVIPNSNIEPLQDSKSQDKDCDLSYPDGPAANTRRKTGGKSKADISESQSSRNTTAQKTRSRPSKPREVAEYSHLKESEVQELITRQKEEIIKLKETRKQNQLQIKSLREQVKKLGGENENMKRELDEIRNTLTGYQSDFKQIVLKNKIKITTDGELQDKFGNIFQKSKAWAEKWSTVKFSDASLAMLEGSFSLLMTEPSRPFATSWIREAAVHGDIGVSVIVNSLVNGLLCVKIFRRPFAHLKLEFGGEYPVEGFLEALMRRAEDSEFDVRVWYLRAIQTYSNAR